MVNKFSRNPSPPLPLEEEERLIARAHAGDADAFSALYQAYVQAVYRFLLLRVSDPSLAEDLTGEVFLRAVDSLPRYSSRGLPFGAWLFRIARDRLIDYYRQKARRPSAELNDNLLSDLPDPGDLAAAEEMALSLRQAMRRLTDEQRDVIQFRFMEEWTLEETARAMNKSVNAIKALQHRALSALNRLMQHRDEDDLS